MRIRAFSRAVVALAALLELPGTLSAQQSGNSVVDSASVARAAWNAAAQALRAGQLDAAQREMDHAAAAWPTQHAYVWNRAVIAARRLDTATVKRALLEYADLGLGRDLRDTVFRPFRSAAWFGAMLAAHDANRRPVERSRVSLRLSDSTLWPEGIDYDARTRNFYVTSVRHRTVVEITPEGGERDVVPRHTQNMGAVLAVRVDPARDLLWLTTSGLPVMQGFTGADTAIAAVVAVRLSDRTIARRYDLPQTARHALGDVAIGPRGDVYASDSNDPVLYWVHAAGDSLEAIRHPLFRSLQGIAPTPDGEAVYVADYSHGILRVDLRTRDVTRVSDAPNSTSVGCDGLVWHAGSLIAVQNGVTPARVMRFHLDASGRRIARAELLDRQSAIADEPTTGTIVGGEFLYIANSQWGKYAPDGSRRKDMPLTRPVVLALPIQR